MRGGQQKIGPCEGKDAGDPVTLRSGSTLTVRVTETIRHPGHFRVLLDRNGTNGEDFPVHETCDEDVPSGGLPSDTTLLAENVLPAPGKHCAEYNSPPERTPTSGTEYTFDVTLPDIECDYCVLQVVQVMTDKGDVWSNAGGSGLYFRCADVRLTGEGPVDKDPKDTSDTNPDNDKSEASVDGGCATTNNFSSVGALFFAALLFTRRSRPLSALRANTSTTHAKQ